MNEKHLFEEIFKKGKVLIPFITTGYPRIELFEEIVYSLSESGADIIEIGIPFSDPLADGVTIQKSSQIALKQGIGLKSVLKMLSKVSYKVDTPLVIMSYYNPILAYGIENFVSDAKKAGIAGIIIPDLPFDENETLYLEAQRAGLKTIMMITPVTPIQRVKEIIKYASGFIYCVSLIGITGDSKKPLFDWISRDLPQIRKLSPLPMVLGFGVDSPETAQRVSPFVDGIVVGSAFIKMIDNLISTGMLEKETILEEVKNFTRKFKLAIEGPK
ncbi:MAG: tryptophan synthase subunit alpha [Synergistetes bacterium]|nr:MAG: Tryptophan synthase alpha chain [bacterium 42_11]MBC7331367.1 tryptophan synthase subunit alpha [Synergistota bacterium]